MSIIKKYREYFNVLQNQNYEIIWAKIWDDTIRGMDWIQDLPGISPGRWAVGYNYIYVMTRILNEKRPTKVLDIGLGISSTLISQYFKGSNIENGIHDVIDHDESWVNFYNSNKRISNITNIHTVKLVKKEFEGITYNAYEDISDIVKNKRYEVISIDGPLGSKRYSRRDVVDYIPEILDESFAIIIDDSGRKGEKDTVREIQEKLSNSGIVFYTGSYPGMTNCTLIVSSDNKFLCSM